MTRQVALPVTSILLILAMVVLLLTVAVTSGEMGQAIYNIVHGSWDLPLSKHALTDHAHEKWNAATILDYFNAGNCTPKEYACSALDIRVFYCELHPGKSVGLIVGETIKQIVTGFMSRTSYWKSRCQ